jgi:hypothetical protein
MSPRPAHQTEADDDQCPGDDPGLTDANAGRGVGDQVSHRKGASEDASPDARAYALDQIARLGESLRTRKDESPLTDA